MTARDDVLAAALQHLNQHPTASMADLAAAAGISRATLHRHFATRDALVIEIGHRSLDRWAEAQSACGLEETLHSTDAETIRACIHAMVQRLVDDAIDFGFALSDPFLCELPEIAARSAELFDREIAFWSHTQEIGVIRADLPARWVGNALYGLLVAAREAIREGDLAPRTAPALVLSSFLEGAAA